jgi:hypothetical protein
VDNPVKLVRLPNAPEDDETYAYNLQEIKKLLAVIPKPAATICAVPHVLIQRMQ